MTTAESPPPLRISGWLRWTTWFLVVATIGGALLLGVVLVFGAERVAATLGVTVAVADASVWWGLAQLAYLLLGVCGVALLLGDGDIGPLVVPVSWIIVFIQLVDAARGLLALHVQFPITAVLFGLYAWRVNVTVKAQRQLRQPPATT